MEKAEQLDSQRENSTLETISPQPKDSGTSLPPPPLNLTASGDSPMQLFEGECGTEAEAESETSPSTQERTSRDGVPVDSPPAAAEVPPSAAEPAAGPETAPAEGGVPATEAPANTETETPELSRRDQRWGRVRRGMYQNNGFRIVNEEAPVILTINEVPVQVYGATEEEQASITETLSMLPASHLVAIPRIVVADEIANGSRETTGGGTINEARAAELSATSTFRRFQRILGWRQIPRIELSRGSFTISGRRATQRDARDTRQGHTPIEGRIWDTLLHETGHAVASEYDLGEFISNDRMPHTHYGGRNQGAGGAGAWENFADAYMSHVTSPNQEHDEERETIDGAYAAVEAQYAERQAEQTATSGE